MWHLFPSLWYSPNTNFGILGWINFKSRIWRHIQFLFRALAIVMAVASLLIDFPLSSTCDTTTIPNFRITAITKWKTKAADRVLYWYVTRGEHSVSLFHRVYCLHFDAFAVDTFLRFTYHLSTTCSAKHMNEYHTQSAALGVKHHLTPCGILHQIIHVIFIYQETL